MADIDTLNALNEIRQAALSLEKKARILVYGRLNEYTRLHVKEIMHSASLAVVQVDYASLAYKEGR